MQSGSYVNSSKCADDDNNESLHLLKKPPNEKKGFTIFKRIFPGVFTNELKLLLEIFFPLLIINLLRFLNPILSMMLCGHLSRLEFDAVALSVSILNILGISIDLGFSTAFDTLFAQIYGADQKMKMGFLLQRALLIMTLLYLFTASLAFNVGPLLIAFKQNSVISELTVIYLTYYWPGIYFDFLFLTISRYLQNQNIVYPMLFSSAIGVVFSIVSQYIALFVYGYGIEASAILQAVSCFVMFIIQLMYMLISGIYKETWDGWSIRALVVDWKIIFLLGIPGIFMTAVEEWNFEIATFVAGSLNPIQLGAQSIAFQVCSISFVFSMSLSIAISIKIGQYLGSNDINRLKTSYRAGIVIGAITSSTSCAILLLCRKYIASAFTNDEEIVKTATYILVFLSFFQFADVTVAITAGMIKATGRQLIGAVTMVCSYYIVGVPLGLVLIYVVHMNIEGMWIGLTLALVTEGLVFIVIIFRTDWGLETERAAVNIGGGTNSNESSIYTESDYDSLSDALYVQSDYEGYSVQIRCRGSDKYKGSAYKRISRVVNRQVGLISPFVRDTIPKYARQRQRSYSLTDSEFLMKRTNYKSTSNINAPIKSQKTCIRPINEEQTLLESSNETTSSSPPVLQQQDQTLNDDQSESLTRLIIKRSLVVIVVIVIFVLCILLRLYVLTPSFYINAENCFTVNNITLKYFNTTYYRDQHSVFCVNQTIT